MKSHWAPLRLGLLSGFAVILCLLIAHPIAETGIMDDWSYVKTAQIFAHTGKFAFNGWATALLGCLIPWGALFIRLVGDSFFAARLSVLPFAFGCIVLFHLCASRFGVRPFNAVLCSLSFGLSPLFLPLASAFMTDVPSLFCLLLCLYLCQSALLSSRTRDAVLWITAATVTSLAGGTVRQTTWLGALVIVPTATWLLRKYRVLLPAAAILWIGSIGLILLAIRWFNRQPYAVPEYTVFHANRSAAHHLLLESSPVLLCLGLILLPILISWTASIFSLRGSRRQFFWVALSLALVGFFLAFHRVRDTALMPWLQQILDSQGVWPRPELLGSGTATLGSVPRIVISIVVIVAWVAFLAQIEWAARKTAETSPNRVLYPAGTLSRSTMLWLIGTYVLAYILLLLPRASNGVVFDRYLLGLVPFLLMLLARIYQDQVSPDLPRIAVVVLCIFSFYSVASLHDWFAALRAHIATLNRMEATGIPRTAIEAGWESDGLAQVDLAGHLNSRDMAPKSEFHAVVPQHRLPACSNWFHEATPVIAPRFVLVVSPLSCFADSAFPPTRFRTWLPPFQRAIYIQQIPPED